MTNNKFLQCLETRLVSYIIVDFFNLNKITPFRIAYKTTVHDNKCLCLSLMRHSKIASEFQSMVSSVFRIVLFFSGYYIGTGAVINSG